ncbi:MAG: hypothetical protein OEX19_11055, partial [Gammaproteobacteria bacterium]|nr:hypothetical protein [Gammaproteobacteria bacterium]
MQVIENSIEKRIWQEQINLIYVQVPISIAAGLGICLAVAIVTLESLSTLNTAVWIGSLGTAQAYTLFNYWQYKRTTPEQKFAYKWTVHSWLYSFLLAVPWGLLGYIVFNTGNEALFNFVLVVLLGLASGSIIGSGSVFSYFLTFAATVLSPSIFLLLASDQNPFHFTMGLLAIFYLIIISLAAHNYNRTLKDALNLRFENAELADNLFDERNKLVSEVDQRKKIQDELLLAKQKAEAANSAKSRFLANMSHEIRTPLSSVIGYADILKNGEQPREVQQQAIETISRSSHHLLNIISDILDLT